ncbi:MAG: hypothetical protein AAGE94_15090 [Acidobacteriota bacterium]
MPRLNRVWSRAAAAAIVALVVACVEPEDPATEATRDTPVRSMIGSASELPQRVEPTTDDDLGADDLEGLGELGVLPNLVQRALAPSPADCDFDDALSTCQ